jgi:fructosamine-3-kinase
MVLSLPAQAGQTAARPSSAEFLEVAANATHFMRHFSNQTVMDRDIHEILRTSGITDAVSSIESCGGGCISSSYVVTLSTRTIFLKTNSRDFEPNFRAEFAGLEKISATNTILCPTPLFVGSLNTLSYLGLSYLPKLGGATADLGAPLARMHLAGQSDRFGFPILTFCGATPLDNEMTNEPWSVWFARHRIGYVLGQLGSGKATKRSVESVVAKVTELLRDHDRDVTPSLVHGDLWGGNGGNSEGKPCIFDPGCYYADPEVDLAMTELFGGFPSGFYRSYESVRPIAAGYKKRKKIYNLYHLLNHGVLFGGGYISQAGSVIEDLFH